MENSNSQKALDEAFLAFLITQDKVRDFFFDETPYDDLLFVEARRLHKEAFINFLNLKQRIENGNQEKQIQPK